jgi:hypothetical protein
MECGAVTPLSFFAWSRQRNQTKTNQTKESGVKPPHSKAIDESA